MATNFDFYKDEILKCLSENSVAINNNKPVKCDGRCNSCIRGNEIGECIDKPLFEWLYAEHIEDPKLTKRERAFCEAVQTGWIVRNTKENLYWFSEKPILRNGRWYLTSGKVSELMCILDKFLFIKWEDEKPWSIEDLLKLDVIEEVQEDS